jgi:hypothetical protein
MAIETAVLVALALASLPWLVHPWYDATYDASMYISCARSLLAGEGYSYVGEPFQMRPPGFSAMLVPLLWQLGTNFLALNAFVSLWGVALIALLYLWQRERLGAPAAFALCAFVWLHPLFRRLSTQVLSDLPSTALMLAVFVLERQPARGAWSKARGAGRSAGIGLLIAAASYVRTVNLLLVPAILCARLLRGETRRDAKGLAAIVLLPALCMLPWAIRNATAEFPRPPDQHPLYSYEVAMFHADKGNPDSPRISAGEFLARTRERTLQVLAALGNQLERASGRPWQIALGAALLAALALAFAFWREEGEAFALLAAGLLCAYFGFAERLLLPVYLIALTASVRLLLVLASPRVGMRSASWIAALVLLALGAWRASPRPAWDEVREDFERRERQCAAARALVPEGARIAMSIGHDHAVQLGHPVVSLRIAIKRTGSLSVLPEVMHRHGVEHVILFNELVLDSELVEYFQQHYGPGVERDGAWAFDVRDRS